MAANFPTVGSTALPMELPRIERPETQGVGGSSFGAQLREIATSADDRSRFAEQLSNEYAAGRQNDLHGTMIAGAQADISIRLLASVRNRCLEAYREVMRMGA